MAPSFLLAKGAKNRGNLGSEITSHQFHHTPKPLLRRRKASFSSACMASSWLWNGLRCLNLRGRRPSIVSVGNG